ncbi:Protein MICRORCHIDIA 2 [Linum perenne]
MATQAKRVPTEVVEIGSSDDEDDDVAVARTLPQRAPQSQQQRSASAAPGYRTLDCRNFWKAGGSDVLPMVRKAPASGELEHARVHPKFLHSNATSHKWAFGAIAELLDNAVDEIPNGASFVRVDKVEISKDKSPALLFLDDGGGMNPEGIRKCMSLGYSSKKSKTTIGQCFQLLLTLMFEYLFVRKETQSVGLLSYTFLRKTGQDDVVVPMIDFDISGHWAEPIVFSSLDDWSSNLKIILEWSPFSSKEELLEQFDAIGKHGTKILIYNLWLNDEGVYELSFDDDDEPYWKVTSEGSTKGQGVVGVLEANFIEPAHDKQDFERSVIFIRLEMKLRQILMEYWNTHCHLFGYQSPADRSVKYAAAKMQKSQPTNQLDTDLPSSIHEMNISPTNALPIPSNLLPETSNQDSVDELCEENIQLFMRCEEQRLEEMELKQKVEELEKQVEQAKRKCAQLAAHLETKRMQVLQP